MKTFIVKRLKDGIYLTISDRDIQTTLDTVVFDGVSFVKQFELVGEDKSGNVDMEALFGTK